LHVDLGTKFEVVNCRPIIPSMDDN
jgi:hypothetical protein